MWFIIHIFAIVAVGLFLVCVIGYSISRTVTCQRTPNSPVKHIDLVSRFLPVLDVVECGECVCRAVVTHTSERSTGKVSNARPGTQVRHKPNFLFTLPYNHGRVENVHF